MAETEFDDPFAEFDDPFAEFDDPQYGPVNPLEQYPTAFPEEPGTSRASRELGEMFVPSEVMGIPTGMGSAELVAPGRTTPETGGGVGSTLTPGQQAATSAAALTMTDPEEIATMLRQFPEIGITYAPDGAIIATNNKTGARGLINRPGVSGMDVVQTLGLMAAFAPAGKATSIGVKTAIPQYSSATMRNQLNREAARRGAVTGMGAAGVTESGIQVGQEQAGGTFDLGDVGFSMGAAGAGERIAYPLANMTTKGKEIMSNVGDVVPKSVTEALDYAEATGRKIFTSDALGEFMTPVQKIFLKSVERIPITGIGRARVRQKAARTDALIDLANKYDINLESELGQDIADSFINRMIKQRFWGKNKELMDPDNWPSGVTKPKERKEAQAKAQELLERAFNKEADEVIDASIAKQLREGNLDGEIVEKTLDQANPRRVTDLFDKLMPEGKKAVQQRFLTRGLERAGWTPDAPQISDPDKFVKYLSDPKNNKMLTTLFEPDERAMIRGAREYMRMTSEAGKVGQGAGMVAAVGGSAAVGTALTQGLWGLAAATAIAGRTIQSKPVRNLLLKLNYAKGDPEKVQRVMQQLRPAVVALQNQIMESGGPPQLPEVEFSRDMMKDMGDYSMDYLRFLGDEAMGTVDRGAEGLSRMLEGEE